MNKLEEMKNTWRNNTESAIATIESCLNYHEDYEEAKDFKKLANWLATTPINHYGFMTHLDAYAIDNAINFASLLQNIHHAMLDDGDICFVSIENQKALMIFAHPQEDYFPALLEQHLTEFNKSLKTSYDITSRLAAKAPNEDSKARITARLNSMPQSTKDLTITTHRSVDRFISEVEEIERVFNERAAIIDEKMKVIRAKKM